MTLVSATAGILGHVSERRSGGYRMQVTLKNLQQQTFQIEVAGTDTVSWAGRACSLSCR